MAIDYQSGFGNFFCSEALAGVLPPGRNSPQQVAHGLYAEKFSAAAFTAPRAHNRRSWLYRIRPSVSHAPFEPLAHATLFSAPHRGAATTPNQQRWDPLPMDDKPVDFIDGLFTLAVNGDVLAQTGIGIHIYRANCSMEDRFFYNADGELLLVPQLGRLTLHTEMGVIELEPGEVGLLPRGIKCRVTLRDPQARGYICENYGAFFDLPERGPIGTDGLANSRDFLAPVAAYDDREGQFELVAKFGGQLFRCDIDHSPLDVVGWHGNLTPYKYDLRRFNTIGSISYDHPDPSIFTVLTSQTDTPGVANADFVVFPPRWLVMEDTFRPPWYHRNVMSEYMGLIYGAYDAKTGGGFVPGGGSLHNCMSPHGPDASAFEAASNATLVPQKLDETMAFMFESRFVLQPTDQAMALPQRQSDYLDCWRGLNSRFVAPEAD